LWIYFSYLQFIPLEGILKIWNLGVDVIRSFANKEVKIFFQTGKVSRHKGWAQIARIVKRKLDMLDFAKDVIDLKSPPSNFLEKLTDDLKGFYSIRINIKWRIIFKWDSQPYEVDVVDYH
jgi:toxin HigB-1